MSIVRMRCTTAIADVAVAAVVARTTGRVRNDSDEIQRSVNAWEFIEVDTGAALARKSR